MGIFPAPDSGRTMTLTAGGTLAQPLEFEAHAVKVDNPTVQWLQLPDVADGFVAPGQLGAVINLGGLTQVNALWNAPPGVAQPAAVTGQQATLRAFSFWMSPTPGVAGQASAYVSSAQQVNLLPAGDLFTIPGNGVPQTRTVTLPTGVIGIAIVLQSLPPGGQGTIAITGLQTNTAYPVTSFAALGGRQQLVQALFPGADSQVKISITNANGQAQITEVVVLGLYQLPPQLSQPAVAPRDAALSFVHVNGAAPIANVIAWTTGNLWLHSWELTFDGAAAGAFASISFGGTEEWNMSLASRLWSSRSFGPVLIGGPAFSPMAFAAPTGAYNARGLVTYSIA